MRVLRHPSEVLCPGTRPGIRVQHQLECELITWNQHRAYVGVRTSVFAQYHGHDVEDLCETDPSIMKRVYAHLVRSVVYGWSRPAQSPRMPGHLNRRKSRSV